jgi:hypothetical protein
MKRTYYDFLNANNHTTPIPPENSKTLLPEYQCAYKYPLDEPKNNYVIILSNKLVLLFRKTNISKLF